MSDGYTWLIYIWLIYITYMYMFFRVRGCAVEANEARMHIQLLRVKLALTP